VLGFGSLKFFGSVRILVVLGFCDSVRVLDCVSVSLTVYKKTATLSGDCFPTITYYEKC
jgi:hypothetical protein